MRFSRYAASLLIASLLPLQAIAQTSANAYRITGILTSSSGGVPIAHGHLSASLVNDEGRIGSSPADLRTESDEHGHFSLAIPSAGDWQLTGRARGFRSQPLDEHEGYFTGIILSAASPEADVAFQLTPEASISGYVLDEAGEPVRTNAQVTVLMATDKLPDEAQARWQMHGSTHTDDRGHYEFTNLAPGRYQVMVQAQPWYAETNSRRNFGGTGDRSTASQLDPALDVAYPLTFFPGVTDPAAASTLTLRGGDSTQADLRLSPVPSVHLRISVPPTTDGRGGGFPLIQQILPSGGLSFQQIRPSLAGEGYLDVGGLAPGTYQVTPQGSDGHPSLLHISSGSPRSLELSAATPETPVTVLFDLPSGTSAPSVQFVHAETGRVDFLSGGSRGREGFQAGPLDRLDRTNSAAALRRRSRDRGDQEDVPQVVHLAPGRYEVRLAGDQGQNLTGITAIGAEAIGRYLSIHGGSPKVTLHIAVGHATVAGVVTLGDKADAGALVLLVPATLGDPQSLTILRRDQSDSDGSFRLRDVTPGRYILLAIDHGWQVNWRDPSTLSLYLLHGVPIDLTIPRSLQQAVTAQLP